MIAPAYKVINNDCPEGATSSGRSPGRGVDSYMFKSENLSLTFKNDPPKISPPSVGGDEGEGEKSFCPPPPSPSPIEGGGERMGNFKYLWLGLRSQFGINLKS